MLDNDVDEITSFFESRHQEMDAAETFLTEIFEGIRKKLHYTYDFGDDWKYEIRLLQQPKEKVFYPIFIIAENAVPKEVLG
ncbi:MAG: hypothetical protein JJT77_12750 [Crocinitomicaceae bacterium]|nr:hypothetical protein [Crocinitomicaceae bacterium]